MEIAELNTLDQDSFVNEVGWVFEDSPWVAARAWFHRPFSTPESLHAAMTAEVESASEAEQVQLLRSHPDLGTRARIADASASEQARAGLDSLTTREFEHLQQLNSAYKDKFGFPFLLAVKGSTKSDIVRSLEQRISQPREIEFREALRQVYRMAEFRLRDMLEEVH
jgi:2-oxo-4-hydroxy-4-carboxy-5-ureidoimidazoline decarboxylase